MSANLIPLCLVGLAWWAAQQQQGTLRFWKRLSFWMGLCAITASSMLLEALVLYSIRSNGLLATHEFATHMLRFSGVLLAALGIPLVTRGNRLAAAFAICTAVMDLSLLYMAGFAAGW